MYHRQNLKRIDYAFCAFHFLFGRIFKCKLRLNIETFRKVKNPIESTYINLSHLKKHITMNGNKK